MKRLSPIMLAGTGSDVGKSLIATGLCRIFLQDGYHPAPFKAQNMALNSYATPDGFEIGRAQAVQAEAAGIPCSTDMNPLLLKPSGEHTSQVVLNGKPVGNRNAYEYFRKEGREELRREVHDAFDRLASRFNPIVMEGAGSISEINLRDSDLVNMSMARYADAKVILVADIDRGGVFASAYGSIMLQDKEDRKRIKGIIINKFRGDMRLFDEGRKMMEEICGVPVLGVVPMAKDIHIEEEDSVALSAKGKSSALGLVNVAVVLLEHISNFTDFDILERNPSVNLFYTKHPDDLRTADIIIIPGTKSTLSDLYALRRDGLAKVIVDEASKGKTVMGICGGYQIMGKEICDPHHVEGDIEHLPGLGLLPTVTTLTEGKVTRQTSFRFMDMPEECRGYEIHMGETVMTGDYSPLNTLSVGSHEGCIANAAGSNSTDGNSTGNCLGTYIHGILDNKTVIDCLLKPFAGNQSVSDFDPIKYKEEQYDKLAALLRTHLNLPLLYQIMETR